MPLLFGPKNSRYTYTGSLCPHNDLAFESKAKTLNEAISDYEAKFNVSITPYQKPLPGETEVKYFHFKDNDTNSSSAVDIHIIRESTNICTKQNLSFPLLETDLVEMGELIC
jgi:hypothetical protein